MQTAKYYIYRNLHSKSFSVQYKGKVIARPKNFVAEGCEFRVSEKGREKVLLEKRKNVHAKIACDSWFEINCSPLIPSDDKQIYYNPYNVSNFQYKGEVILSTDRVLGLYGEKIFKF